MSLRVGVIGCGSIARAVHIPLLGKMKDVRVAVLADSDPASLETARLLSPSAAVFDNHRDLIESGLVDAVVIATPATHHKDAAVAAFQRGLHVYLEKPIAMTLADAARIADAWRHSGRVGAIGFNYRFNRLITKLRDACLSGKQHGVSTFFSVPTSGPSSWRRSRALGGGVLLELASHDIDLVRFLTGEEIREVNARIESHRSEHDFAHIELKTSSGLHASITVAFATAFKHMVQAVVGEGVLMIDFAKSHAPERVPTYLRLPSPGRMSHIVRKLRSPLREPSYAAALENFVKSCNGSAAVSPDIMDGYESLLVIQAAEQSAASGKPVMVRN